MPSFTKFCQFRSTSNVTEGPPHHGGWGVGRAVGRVIRPKSFSIERVVPRIYIDTKLYYREISPIIVELKSRIISER